MKEAEQEIQHVSNTVYLIVGAFLILITGMEVTVAYIHAIRPVMVPVLVILGIAKFSLIALFFMHLHYEKWVLNTMFLFPLTIALGTFFALLGLFSYLGGHLAFGPPFHIFAGLSK